MLVLYYGPGANARDNVFPSTTDNFGQYKLRLCDLLRTRGESLALDLITRFQWQLRPVEINWTDQYNVLQATAYLEDYEYARTLNGSAQHARAFETIVQALGELGAHRLRYILVSLAERPVDKTVNPNSLTPKEIKHLVKDYIGVDNGYLGEFTYRTHLEFYEDLELPYNPHDFSGTTRERFISILSNAPAHHQAIILQGILELYPPASKPQRSETLHTEIKSWIARLDGVPAVLLTVRTTSAVVTRALADADQLIGSSGATSAVDRVHTALHGYMKQICDGEEIATPEDASLTQMFKLLRTKHPQLTNLGPRAEDIAKALQGLASVIDALNPIRNKASIAHPNEILLAEPEALLVINSVRTILNYLDKKLS